jgi:hypothetical protein
VHWLDFQKALKIACAPAELQEDMHRLPPSLTWYRSALPARRVASAPFMPAQPLHKPV